MMPKLPAEVETARIARALQEPDPALLSVREVIESEGDIWLPPRDSNPDMLIQSQLSCR